MKRLTPDIIFRSTNLDTNLTVKSVQGGINTIGSQLVRLVLQIAGTMILARLLTPSDYGLIGMVTVVMSFATMFKDAGLSIATVQKDKITHEQVSTLFWINVLISIVLCLFVLMGSPFVGAFYNKPELTAVTAMLSISFVVSGISIQHAALLRRHMRFGNLAIVEIVAQIVTLSVTILLATFGWRYWALVGGSLTRALSVTMMTFFFCPWIPGRFQKNTGIRDMLKFGCHVTGFNFINYFARNSDNILIGKLVGADALGIYSKAYQLCLLPISQIRGPLTNVAMPVLSSLKNQPDRYAKYYLRFLNIVATLTIPLMLYCYVEAEFLIELLLGTQWLEAIPIFQILAIAGVVEPTFGTVGVVMLSLGHSKRYLKIGIFNSVMIILAFVIGVQFGAIGVAMAFTIITYLKILPSILYCFYKTPITVSLFLLSYVLPTIISGISIYISFLIQNLWPKNAIWGHIVFLFSFVFTYTFLSFTRKSIRKIAGHIYASYRQ